MLLSYQGTWDANANSPTIQSGVGTTGFYYRVSAAGSSTIDGNGPWNIGDRIVFNGTAWDRITAPYPPFSETVLSQSSQGGVLTALGLPTAALNAATGLCQLDGSALVPVANLPPSGASGAMTWQGSWNASTNSPALVSGTGTKGFLYTVSVAGTTTLDGISSWSVGDHAAFTGTVWEKWISSGNLTTTSTSITDATAAGRAILTAANVAAQRAALLVDQVTLVNDTNQTITAAMQTVAWTAISANRTGTLPAASALNAGQGILIYDESGNCSPNAPITIAASGTDTINGSSNLVLSRPFTGVFVVKGSAGKFTTVDFADQPILNPTGRLTLATGTPIMTSTVSGATSIIYTPYRGQQAPIWQGFSFVNTVFTEISQALSDATKSPAAAAVSSLYDMFLWNDGGTLRCTRGPAWASTTSRGTGSGTTQLSLVQGFYVNAVNITNGPIVGYGLYVGTIATNASGTVDWILGGTASGGTAVSLGVANYFNPRDITGKTVDSSASYVYISATPRTANGSNGNTATYISPLGEDPVQVIYSQTVQTAATIGAAATINFAIDGTQAVGTSQTIASTAPNSQTDTLATTGYADPAIGLHVISGVEIGDGTNVNMFNFASNATLRIVVKA